MFRFQNLSKILSFVQRPSATIRRCSEVKQYVNIVVWMPNGNRIEARGVAGKSVMQCVKDATNLRSYGTCCGDLVCNTCHIIMRDFDFDRLTPPELMEQIKLTEIFSRTNTSRFGCQVTLEPWMEGMEIYIPAKEWENYDARKRNDDDK